MIRVVFNIFRSILSLLLRPLKRLWCRRLKASEMDPGVPTIVTMQSTAIDIPQSFEGREEMDMDMESWDTWDMSVSQSPPAQNSQSDAAYYAARSAGANQHMRGRKPDPELEPEPDYFQDMIPDFKRPAKILVKKKDGGSVNSSTISTRLSVLDVIPTTGTELTSWEEGQNEWSEEIDEDLSWEAEEALREKRRSERQNRTLEQQRKKQERDSLRGVKKDSHLAVKIS